MSTRQLPPELLDEIFSNLSSSPPDLYLTLLACKTFCQIIKPILYQQIIIDTAHRRSRLLDVRVEDKRLVKHLTIVGEGWIDPELMDEHFEEGCVLGTDCVLDLLQGKLLDISVIEILHIRNVHEDPEVAEISTFNLDIKTASNLKEISVRNHQGAGEIWTSFLDKQYVPRLRRLGFAEVTTYDRLDYDSSAASSDYDGDSDESEPVRKGLLEELDTELGVTAPYSQLEVLVAAPSANWFSIPNFPFDNFLALCNPNYPVPTLSSSSTPIRHFRLIYEKRSFVHGFFAWLSEFEAISAQNSDQKLHLYLWGRPLSVSATDYKKAKQSLTSKGIEVHDHSVESDGKEDKALVKRITIVGSGPYGIEEGERVKENDDGPRGGCIRSLLYGQVLDIATVETLEVLDIVEIPEAHFLSNPFKTASKLRKISISGHQGGADLWTSYLKHENLPNLRRLGFSDVTRYVPEENGDYSGDESYGYEYAEQAGFVADEWIELPTTLPYSQLEVLVGLPPPNLTDIPNFPLDNFLALVPFSAMSMNPLVKACRLRFSRTRGFKPSLVDQLRPESSAGYPHTLHFFISGRYSPNDEKAYQDILGKLRARSIEIHEDENEDEDDSDSLIYPSFVEFLRKAGRLQED
ncbi:hypothetical protein JCM3765_004278 [Sporobolomyces pararoseus]